MTNAEGRHGFDFAPPPLPGSGTAPGPVAVPDQGSGGRGAGRRRPRRRSNGRWVLVAIVIAIALIIGGIAWGSVLAYRSAGVTPADPNAIGTLHTGQVVSGMCIKEAPDLSAPPGPVRVLPCADAHHAEAVVSYTFTSSTWPGTDSAWETVSAFCAKQLNPTTGAFPASPGAPDFEWHVWIPTAQTWGLGDRAGLCVITTEDPVAGSFAAGTARDATEDAIVG